MKSFREGKTSTREIKKELKRRNKCKKDAVEEEKTTNDIDKTNTG